ncbi:MAG TPA: Maf family nucleotide pyrophosphatase [Prolixibacteraceae bacterium]|nr:Maf family nucleotide pyrophosphatase [Prolixibacteraceae bacterium]
MLQNIKAYKIILASKSPRRKQLLEELGIKFEVKTIDTDESYPAELLTDKIAEYLAIKKAIPFKKNIDEQTLVITADTIVAIDNEVLGKPANYNEAFSMLTKLSGKAHLVSTGVCITSKHKNKSFTSSTKVFFKTLTKVEIDHYIKQYQPFDKAGAYGIQEWIGFIAVERIEGSYFNVMGLPVQRLYEELCDF